MDRAGRAAEDRAGSNLRAVADAELPGEHVAVPSGTMPSGRPLPAIR